MERKKTKSQTQALDKIFRKIIGYKASEKLISNKPLASIKKIKDALAKSSKNPIFPFNKTETFKTGKQRIKRKTEKKSTEDIKNAEQIIKIFNSPAGKNNQFLSPCILENNAVHEILKRNRRNFGSLSNSNLSSPSQATSIKPIKNNPAKRLTHFSVSKPIFQTSKNFPLSLASPILLDPSPILKRSTKKLSNFTQH